MFISLESFRAKLVKQILEPFSPHVKMHRSVCTYSSQYRFADFINVFTTVYSHFMHILYTIDAKGTKTPYFTNLTTVNLLHMFSTSPICANQIPKQAKINLEK